MDENGVLSTVFDPAARNLKTELVAGPAAPNDISEDKQGVWSQCLDPATGQLRVVLVP